MGRRSGMQPDGRHQRGIPLVPRMVSSPFVARCTGKYTRFVESCERDLPNAGFTVEFV